MPRRRDPSREPRTSVSITVTLHRKIKLLAAERNVKVGDLAEQAISAHWFAPTMRRKGPPSQMDEPLSPEQVQARALGRKEQEFQAIFDAATSEEIVYLEGKLEGTYGPVRREDLANHLRGALEAGRAICTLDELIVDYCG